MGPVAAPGGHRQPLNQGSYRQPLNQGSPRRPQATTELRQLQAATGNHQRQVLLDAGASHVSESLQYHKGDSWVQWQPKATTGNH